jgi:hypothetical protein
MNDTISKTAAAQQLELSLDDLLQSSMAVTKANGGAMYITDLFVLGAAKRAMSLSKSIFQLLDDEYAISAVTLARPHLDTLLRLNSLWLVNDIALHTQSIMDGERLDRMKDRDGHRMTDSHLMKQMAAQEGMGWVKSVYERTSGFVHLSDNSMFQVFRQFDSSTRVGGIIIGAQFKASTADEAELKLFVLEVNRHVVQRVKSWAESKSAFPPYKTA